MLVRCFFNAGGKLQRVVFADTDDGLKHHQPLSGEVLRDIPHDVFHSKLITIHDDAIEAYHAAQK